MNLNINLLGKSIQCTAGPYTLESIVIGVRRDANINLFYSYLFLIPTINNFGFKLSLNDYMGYIDTYFLYNISEYELVQFKCWFGDL